MIPRNWWSAERTTVKAVRLRTIVCACVASGTILASVAQSRDSGPPSRAVALYRDSYGLAHVYADREEDGFYGMGYATAQDRLIAVLTWYVAVRGELAATFGPETPDIGTPPPSNLPAKRNFLSDAVLNDTLTRRYQILESARSNLKLLPKQYQRDIQSYVDGLSAYMREHPEQVPSWAPTLEPALPLATLDRLVLEQRGLCSGRRLADSQTAMTQENAPQGENLLPASNAWVIGGSRTADHRVIFESDSHGPIESYATAFYPVRIKAGSMDLYAQSIVGSMSFLFGHTRYFAWGYTEGPRDLADCYRVQVDPAAPTTYFYDGVRKQMLTRPYKIAVRGKAPVKGVFEYTRHNGVLSPVEERSGNTAYVVSYTSAERVGMSGLVYYLMSRAQNRAEIEGALARMDAYPANLLVGGADGTYMFIRPGRIPIRPANLDIQKTLDGNTSATAWKGIHTYEQSLKLIDPPQGYVGNTNVSPDMMYPESPLRPENYPSYFGFRPGDTNSRQLRLIELLDHSLNLTATDVREIAMDETVPTARIWGRVFRQLVSDGFQSLTSQPAPVRTFIEELARFDGKLSKESRSALYMSHVTQNLAESHGADMTAISQTVEKGEHLTAAQQQVLIKVSVESFAQIQSTYKRTDLAWGDTHRIGRGHVDLPVGGGNIAVGASPADGGPNTPVLGHSLRALQFVVDPATKLGHLIGGQRVPFLVHFGASGVESYVQALWGISDDPASPHYSDQAALASERTLRPLPLSVEDLEREGASKTILTVHSVKH